MDYVSWSALATAVVALALATIALVQSRRSHARLAEVTPDIRGLAQRVQGKTPEEAFAAIFSQLETVGRKMGQLELQMVEVNRVVTRAIRRVGLVRYDANESIRGQLSFALCMLDNRDNGLMLTSIYDLNTCRVFVRGIVGGKAQHDLMPEEAAALAQAIGER